MSKEIKMSREAGSASGGKVKFKKISIFLGAILLSLFVFSAKTSYAVVECTGDDGCEAGATCENVDQDTGVGECVSPLSSEGQACSPSQQCESGLDCVGGTCAPALSSEGQACGSSQQCESGLECVGGTCDIVGNTNPGTNTNQSPNGGTQPCVAPLVRTSNGCGYDSPLGPPLTGQTTPTAGAQSKPVPKNDEERCAAFLGRFDLGNGNISNGQPFFCSATDTILAVINYALVISGIITVLFLIVGGFWYVTSAGNEEQAEKGKKTIINSVIGLVVIILAFTIVRIIAATLSSVATK